MPIAPAKTPDWNTGLANNVEPSSGRKVSGFLPVTGGNGDEWASGEANWLLNLIDQWLQFLQAPVATGAAGAIDAQASATAGSAGLVGRSSGVSSAGIIALTGGVAGEAALRATYGVNSAFLMLAAGAGQACYAVAVDSSSSWAIVAKAESASASDIVAAQLATTRPAAVTGAAGGTVAIYGRNNSASDGAVHGANQGAGPGTRGTSSSGPGVVGSSTTGPGASLSGNASRAAVLLIPQATPSVPTAGDVWAANGTFKRLMVSDGTLAIPVCSGVIGAQLTLSTAVANVTFAKFASRQLTLPKEALYVGAQIEIEALLFFNLGAASQSIQGGFVINGASGLTISGWTVISTAAENVVPYMLRARGVVTAISGTVGSITWSYQCEIGSTTGLVQGSNAKVSAGQVSGTLNTTADMTFDMAVLFNAAAVGNSAQLQLFTLRIL